MSTLLTPSINRRSFLKASGFGAASLLISSPRMYGDFNGLIDNMLREAKTAKVNVIPLGSNIFVIKNRGGNITVADGPDGKLMVDAGISGSHPQIIAALTSLSGNPLREVISTHWHFDHTGGNPWLHEAGARITAHRNTRKHMSVATPVTPWKYTFPPTPEPGLPTRLLETDTSFSMNGMQINVTHPEHAHTDGDLVVAFKNGNVIATADTFWNGYYPFIDIEAGGTINGMINATKANLSLSNDTTKIVPGHGPIATKVELQEYHDMLVSISSSVSKLKNIGVTIEAAVAAKPTAGFDAKWGHYAVDPDDFVRLVYKSSKDSIS
jgi:glyoxylase-like metal-dependent hydrolase (beta-lactamase superfamily II)